MIGMKDAGGNDAGRVCKRVPRPFDQADIDGEPVETTLKDDVPFFIATSSVGATTPAARDPDLQQSRVSSVPKDASYGDVSGSSFGDDIERERDA